MSFNKEDLINMLSQLEAQKELIYKTLNSLELRENIYYLKPQRKHIFYDIQDDYLNCYKSQVISNLHFGKRYHLVTFTFDPSLIKATRSTLELQQAALDSFYEKFKDSYYVSCNEKHKTGVLHGHMLIIIDPIELPKLLYKYLSLITFKHKLSPAVKIQLVKDTQPDIIRSVSYIFDHKDDHPKYKDIFLNIDFLLNKNI